MSRVLQANLENCGGAFQLIYQAQKILKDQVQFDYYTMGNFEQNDVYYNLIEMGSNIYEADLRKNRLIGHIILPFKFYRFLKKNRHSIVHINSDSAWKILMYAVPAKFSKIDKIIIHSHSSEINGDYIILKKICHYIAKGIIKYCGTDFCGCSDESVRWMYGKNFEGENIEIINNSVNAEKFKFNPNIRDELRESLNIQNKCVIGTVGNFSYQKNPEFLVELIYELNKRKEKKYMLFFVGEGAEEDKIKKIVHERHLDSYVIFYGKTSKVNEVLNAFDIFILPSRFEGLPVSGIEAQTNGLPCVFSSSITKEVEISDYCHYIDLSESISNWCSIIQSIDFKYDRKNAYRNTIMKNFDIKYTADQLKKLYCCKNGDSI